MEFHSMSGEIVVAVSGHRIIHDEDIVFQGITQALQEILDCWGMERLCIFTALAEGADRMVIRAARSAAPFRYVAILPMISAEYQKDFNPDSAADFLRLLEEADSVRELEEGKDREEAYYRAGVAVLEYCDVLIAVWDGESAHGHGGTGEIVQLACERNLPMAWVYAARSDRMRQGFEKSGRISFERFPGETLPPEETGRRSGCSA